MKYTYLARYVAETLWAITPSKLAELLSVLAFRAAGHEFTPEEIRARIGDGGGESPKLSKTGGVALIPIHGVLAHRMNAMDESSGGTSAERIGQMVSTVAADPSIGTILYDYHTPGGTVPGIQELAARMFALRGVKKQIAMVNDQASSAGYWLASQADEIVSIPSGVAGSIGVFTAHTDLSQALEKEGIDVTLISAGKYKLEGNPFEPLSDEAKAVLQARVDEAYGWFVRDVARGRKVAPRDVREGYGEGRALTAKDALKAGLIDSIGTFEETVGRLTGRKADRELRAEVAAEPIMAVADTTGEDYRRRRLGLT